MSEITGIQWTGSTWLFWPGCIPKSAGCLHCYAIKDAWRLAYNPNQKVSAPYKHIVKKVLADGTEILGGDDHPRRREPGVLKFTGLTRFLPGKLDMPLRWSKPRKIFVSANSDLFLPARVDSEIGKRQIAAAVGVMAAAEHHTFQVLTKWPENVAKWFAWLESAAVAWVTDRDGFAPSTPLGSSIWRFLFRMASEHMGHDEFAAIMNRRGRDWYSYDNVWPLPNVWLGASVEDVKAKARIDALRQLPAATRFLSLEPLLEDLGELDLSGIDLAIMGGESGGGARPCDADWLRAIVEQCREQGVHPFVKQLGSAPFERSLGIPFRRELKSNKGGDMSEWTEDLRVREMPGSE